MITEIYEVVIYDGEDVRLSKMFTTKEEAEKFQNYLKSKMEYSDEELLVIKRDLYTNYEEAIKGVWFD